MTENNNSLKYSFSVDQQRRAGLFSPFIEKELCHCLGITKFIFSSLGITKIGCLLTNVMSEEYSLYSQLLRKITYFLSNSG